MSSESVAVFRGCTPVVDVQYRYENDQTPVEAIVVALAEIEGSDATALPPLYNVIDTDALNRLFAREDDEGDTAAILSFQYDTWNIFVRSDGRIRICDATKPTNPEPVFSPVPS